MVIHDASLKRTALIDSLVCDLTSRQLEEIDVGSWYTRPSFEGRSAATSYANEKLPTLAQVFQLFNSNRGWLYVEMKSDGDEGTELAASVVKCIHESDLANRVVVESFDLPAIAEIKRIDAGIRTAALFEPRLSRPISTIRRLNMVDLARQTGADEIALHYTLASPRVVKKAREYGLETVVWTVDDPRWIGRACSLGIKGLISNDPATMVRHRNAAGYS